MALENAQRYTTVPDRFLPKACRSPIRLPALGPPLHSFAGVRLNMTAAEVLKEKGQPIAQVNSDLVYNSVDSRHDGVITVFFSHPSQRETGLVSAVEFTGHDQTSAPPEIPYLNSLKTRDVIKKYGEPITTRSAPDGTKLLWFHNGVYIGTHNDAVYRYGIFDHKQEEDQSMADLQRTIDTWEGYLRQLDVTGPNRQLADLTLNAPSNKPDPSETAKAGEPSDPVESLQPGWTPELLQPVIDKCVNQVLGLAFAGYRRRNNLPPPTEAETASMVNKVSESNNPMILVVRSQCNCVTHALAKRRDPVYYANHDEEMQSDLAEIYSGECPAPQMAK
jgi:hypothetical protein